MKINEEYGIKLYELLKDLPVCIDRRNIDGFIVTRCPFCGDSVKSKDKGHLYIKVILAIDEVSWYICQKCQTSGHTDDYLLSMLNRYDDELEFLRKVHKTNISKKIGNLGIRDTKRQPINLLPPLNNIYTKAKLNYINNRLKIKLTQADIDRYRIVFNLKDFMNYNNIKIRTRHDRVIDMLDEVYVGFLTAKDEFVNCRIIDDNLINVYNKRYENYNLFDAHDNTRRFITFKNKIDVMKNITIVSTEGPFDLMGVYEHVYDKRDKNKIFVANMGMSAESVVMYYMKKGIIFNKLQLYADQGVTLDYYRKLKKNLGYKYRGEIEVFYNDFKDKKDFGVPKDEITIKSFLI